MAYVDEIKLVLSSHAPLALLLTGGIYTFAETGKEGVGPTGTPDAFSQGYLTPMCVIVERSEMPWGGIHDHFENTESTRKVVEIYYYNDADVGYNVIREARDMVYGLLHNALIGGLRTKWLSDVNDLRDEVLNNAAMIRSDYQGVRIRRG